MRRSLHDTPLVGPPKLEVRVDEGEMLFVKRGDPHEASTAGMAPNHGTSVHLTIGISPIMGHDLLRMVADEMANDALFRTEMPLVGDRSERLGWLEEFRHCVAK
jgi:hypothetical protein